MYYIFKKDLKNTIYQALQTAQGIGFWDMKPHQKCVEITQIPNSNTDSTPIRDFRTVFVLETVFATEDATLKAKAEEFSEFYSAEPAKIHEYLNTPDVN